MRRRFAAIILAYGVGDPPPSSTFRASFATTKANLHVGAHAVVSFATVSEVTRPPTDKVSWFATAICYRDVGLDSAVRSHA